MQGTLVGYIGQDPQIRESMNGTFTTFSVAENHYNPETQERDITTWYSVIINGRRGEVIAANFDKGDGIILHGESQGVWQGDNGNVSINFRARDFTFPPRAPQGGGKPAAQGAPVAAQAAMGDDPFA